MNFRFDYPVALHGREMDTGPDGTRAYWGGVPDRDLGLLSLQTDFAHPRLHDGQRLLKQARQRFIFWQHPGRRSVVVKLFPLSSLGSKLRHPKYAYREFSNTVAALACGMAVPEPIAFLEKRHRGLVTCSGIVQEALDDHTDLLTLYREGALSYADVARIAAPVLALAYETGANHIDLRDENIMLDQTSDETRVIDWQYASFVAPRAAWLLEYLLAYFIKLAPQEHREMLIATLPDQALALCNHPSDTPTLTRAVRALLAGRMKLRRRFALHPVALS